jgi:hypothetical protein
MNRRSFLTATLAALIGAAGPALAGPAAAAPEPTGDFVRVTDGYQVVGTWVDQTIDHTGMVPQVIPTITCGNASRKQVWFGYESSLPAGTSVAIGQNNKLAWQLPRKRGQTVARETTQSVISMFLPGVHERAFVFNFPDNAIAPRWHVVLGKYDGDPSAMEFEVTVGRPAPCPRGTPMRSASVQFTAGEPLISATPEAQEFGPEGLLRTASIRFSVANVTTSCSGAGVPMDPTVTYGYRDYDPVPNTAPNWVAFDPATVQAETFLPALAVDPITYLRTTESQRFILDPQRTPPGGSFLQGTGIAGTTVLSDVVARCNFSGKIVSSTESSWLPASGFPLTFKYVTDGGQFTRAPVALGGLNYEFIDVSAIVPSGARFR